MNKEDILKRGWGRECGRGTKTMKSISEDSVMIRKSVLGVKQKDSGQRDEGGPGCGNAYLQSCLFKEKNCSLGIQP